MDQEEICGLVILIVNILGLFLVLIDYPGYVHIL